MVQAGNDTANRLGGIETRRPAAPVVQPASAPRIVQSRSASSTSRPAMIAEAQSLLDRLKRAQ
jgi:hypothetical protein